MSKYIDAEQLKNAFTNWREIVNNPYDLFPSVEECKAVIDAQPTADVAEVVKEWCDKRNCIIVAREDFPRLLEVRHGHWKGINRNKYNDDEATCSVCGVTFSSGYSDPSWWDYCPSCGAKMDGEEK